jgi:hypothetical protein
MSGECRRGFVTRLYPNLGTMDDVRWRVTFCCLCVALAAASCAEAAPSSQAVPVTSMPAKPLAFAEYGHVCRTRISGAEYRGAHSASSAVLTVSTDLAGATAFWLPGAQGTPCRSVGTAIPAAAARRLAVLVNKAQPLGTGAGGCGSSDGTQVWIYLRPEHARGVQKLTVIPDGCLGISADGLSPRSLPVAVMRTLAPYAPPGWAAYLHNGV